jgi:NHL repeat
VTSTVTKPEISPEVSPEVSPETRPAKPYALLRAGFPYHATLGMRRVTTFCMDVAIGEEGRLYALCRNDGQGGSIRLTNWDDDDLGTMGGSGRGDGQFVWPVQLIRDRQEQLYVSDEGLHRISVFAPDKTFLGKWGEHGHDPGQLDRPSGIAFDADENVYVADTMNHRVQKFTKDGTFLAAFGSRGRGEGEFEMPWGVAVDADGDVYVADRGNHRVLQFDRTGRFVEEFLGDATLSKSGRTYIMANPKVLRAREMTTLGQSKRLRGPASVRLDDEGRMYIPDFGSHRIQVYKKEVYHLSPEEIWPEQKAPFLYTV